MTYKEYLAKPVYFRVQYERMIEVISRMRRERVSLPKAARELRIRQETVVELGGSALKRLPGGRYVAKPVDTLLRILLLPSYKGNREVAFRDSREASLVGDYWNAVQSFLSTDHATLLRQLRRKWVLDENGNRVQLLTDLKELRRQGLAGEFSFESIYPRKA
jgi:hypothetical protein